MQSSESRSWEFKKNVNSCNICNKIMRIIHPATQRELGIVTQEALQGKSWGQQNLEESFH